MNHLLPRKPRTAEEVGDLEDDIIDVKKMKSRAAARRHRQARKDHAVYVHRQIKELDERNRFLKQVVVETTAELLKIKRELLGLDRNVVVA